MKVKEIGEFKLIEKMNRFLDVDDRVVLGIGDDCAALKFDAGSLLLTTTDILIEKVHFHLDHTTPEHLAVKSLAVNLSDIASMGGTPLYALVSLGIPSTLSVEFVEDFYKGLGEYSRKYQVSIVGGDTSSSRSGLIINIVLLGAQKKDLMVTRSGAEAGDQLFVTGTLGDSSLGLKVFDLKQDEIKPGFREHADYVIGRHSFPSPRIEQGKFLAENKLASSMIDLSDGVASDIRRLCEQSRVGAKVFSESIPLSKEMKELAQFLRKDPLEFALYGGEDYELMFTVKKENLQRFETLKKNLNLPVSCIGEIVNEAEGINQVRDKNLFPMERTGFEHFSR
jgi:thiamine-monophosphate kinase